MGAIGALLLMLVSAGLLLRLVRRFRADWRRAEIVRVPALPRQQVNLPAGDDHRLFLEGPRYRTWGKRLRYALADAVTGAPVTLQPALSGAGVRSRHRSRVQQARIRLAQAALLELEIAGLEPSDPEEFEVVFMRPFTAQLLKFVFACVGLGMVLVGSLVLAILLLALGG